jgi:hypothetical protein
MTCKASTQDVVLMSGTKFEWYNCADDSWNNVPKVTTIGAIGSFSEPKEKTTLSDSIKTYGAGMRDAEDKSIKGMCIPYQGDGDEFFEDYKLQQAFFTAAKGEKALIVRVQTPNGRDASGAKRYEGVTFQLQLLGFQIDDAKQEDWKQFTINAKQNSVVMWGVSAEAVTVKAGATVAVAVTTDPIEYLETAYSVTADSDDEAVATVLVVGRTVTVTGFGVGSTFVTIMVDGLSTVTEVTVTAAD